MNKKVILVNPSERTKLTVYPLACLALAGRLEEEGYHVLIFDNNLDDDYESFLKENLDGAICVGISALTGPPPSPADSG